MTNVAYSGRGWRVHTPDGLAAVVHVCQGVVSPAAEVWYHLVADILLKDQTLHCSEVQHKFLQSDNIPVGGDRSVRQRVEMARSGLDYSITYYSQLLAHPWRRTRSSVITYLRTAPRVTQQVHISLRLPCFRSVGQLEVNTGHRSHLQLARCMESMYSCVRQACIAVPAHGTQTLTKAS
jgi:hypothetical protein